ncbi:MAG: sensor histidine kinase [Parahaliea sp.]
MIGRPQSIVQLVLLGLLAVVAPLCVAIIFTVQTLGGLAQEGAALSETVVTVTRVTQVLQSDILELERRARQYLTLEDENLLNLFRQERLRLLVQLEDMGKDTHRVLMSDDRLSRARNELAAALQAVPDAGPGLAVQMERFLDLAKANSRFQLLSKQYVDRRLSDYRSHADGIRRSLVLLVLLLGLLTLLLSLGFIHWLIRPIRQLETEIRSLGQTGPGREIHVSTGPREVQALALQLEWLREQINEADSKKQQFLMHMSHELKTPLASLREGVDLLADHVAGPLNHRQQEIADIMQENSLQLQRMIENLLDYNRAEHRADLQSKPVDLRDLCDELLQIHGNIIRRKKLRVHLDISRNKWTSDPQKLRTVVDNLLSNAVNYAPRSGVIELHSRMDLSALMLEVANTGQAIPEEERTRIFLPFFQGSNSRTGPIKGSGIGLCVARECTRDLGGTLDLVERVGYATCFRMTLPQAGQVAA